MQTTVRKPTDKRTTKLKEKCTKEELTSNKVQDEKYKSSHNIPATPRTFGHKTSATDIYSQAKKTTLQSAKTPKKVSGLSKTNAPSPMKDYLRSSPSMTSQISSKTASSSPVMKKKVDARTPLSTARKTVTQKSKDLPFTSVTVNSPLLKKRSDIAHKTKEVNTNKEVKISKEVKANKDMGRQRTKTRTLDENEILVLTPDVVDNNVEMLKLTRKLTAKPKAFYINLDKEKKERAPLSSKVSDSSENEVSYEDDFESYESDFESYHSDKQSSVGDEPSTDREEQSSDGDKQRSENVEQRSEINVQRVNRKLEYDEQIKRDIKDEERMLDSGNFDLREAQRSANKSKPMAFITEAAEDQSSDEKKASLTDEGFQDMAGSGAASTRSMSHVETIERPMFIDFKKSKENKRKRLMNERLQQRASDILGMVTLHEMSHTLFEMKPIPYDLFMSTFGRTNHTQNATQTFDDGVSEEIQTDEIITNQKWTQFPVRFSKNEIHLNQDVVKNPREEDLASAFTFLYTEGVDKKVRTLDNDYRNNSLRIFLEQKSGVGTDEIMQYEEYESKLNSTQINTDSLKKFLKKTETRISNILTMNTGNTVVDGMKTTKFAFSKGFTNLYDKNAVEFTILKNRIVSAVALSQTKSNFLMTIHNTTNILTEQCLVCLWNVSVASQKPLKILVSVDNVDLCRYRGSSDGVFVSALIDGSIHLWDLSEEPMYIRNFASEKRIETTVDFNTQGMTQTEIDREWNLRNSDISYGKEDTPSFLQACAYTSSAASLQTIDYRADTVTGLELRGNDADGYSHGGGLKVVGKVCSLQITGVLTIWTIIQDKSSLTEKDIGKAYWSRMSLQKQHTISLAQQIGLFTENCSKNKEDFETFNLPATKRRIAARKEEKLRLRKVVSRQNSAANRNSDRLVSAVNKKKKNVTELLPVTWESGLICTDLKIATFNRVETFLVARNCGEVLCCTRVAGDVKVKRFCIATDQSTITTLEVSPLHLPYFMAATDSGTVHLCSMLETRVLLTLDCRNGPPTQEPSERIHSDHKGRYIGSVPVKPVRYGKPVDETQQISVKSVSWLLGNPCAIFTLTHAGVVNAWDFTHSDIYPRSADSNAAVQVVTGDGISAVLTQEGEVHLHRLSLDHRQKTNEQLFLKYVALL